MKGHSRKEEESEALTIWKHSKLVEFLSPTAHKKAFHLLSAVLLGFSYVLVYLGARYNNTLVYWSAFTAFLGFSFPSFLLLQGYGTLPLTKLGVAFYGFSILLEALWLYLIACTIYMLLKRKGKGEK